MDLTKSTHILWTISKYSISLLGAVAILQCATCCKGIVAAIVLVREGTFYGGGLVGGPGTELPRYFDAEKKS